MKSKVDGKSAAKAGRGRAPAALEETSEIFRSSFENAPIGIYHSSADRLLRVNLALARMFGYETAEEMLANCLDPARLFVDPFQRRRILDQARGSSAYVQAEVEYRRRDGSTFTARLWMRAVRVDPGKADFLEGFIEDVSLQKRLEKQVALRQQSLNSFFANAPAGLCILDPDLRFVQINEPLAQINGLPAREHLGKTLRQVLPGLAPFLEPLTRRVLETRQSMQGVQISGETPQKPGELRHWIVSYFPLLDENAAPEAIGCVVVEVTDLKRAENGLRESEEKFRQLAENIDKVFWICDKDISEMLYVSPAYETVWGRSCQSLYEHPRSFIEAVHPLDRERVLAALDGEARGEIFDLEYRVVRPGGSVRWVHDRSFRVRNEQGEVYRLAGLAEDITDRKQLEERLRQAQKMEAIGQLAGGVAHDFNNILAAVLMHLGLLQQSPQLTRGMKDALKDVEAEAVRAANLTRQLLLFSRRQVARTEPLDLNALINDLLKMLRRLLGENIEVVLQQAAAPVWVNADTGMLEQVVMNLCINARDAMPRGGRLTLATTLVKRPTGAAQSHPDARPGNFACLEATDTGCGMDDAVLRRLFEPFFTTKEVGKGTGLGLATVYGIVKQHEGWVEVQSRVGQGSSFRVYLPALPAPVLKPSPAAAAQSLSGGSETILLVEDDQPLRRTIALCLRKLGYAVLEAASGAEARHVWSQHRTDIDLLLTDMVMPDTLTGLELAELLRQEKPTLRIIISSGYSENLAQPHTPEPTIVFLAKPYQPADLAKLVRESLDTPAPVRRLA